MVLSVSLLVTYVVILPLPIASNGSLTNSFCSNRHRINAPKKNSNQPICWLLRRSIDIEKKQKKIDFRNGNPNFGWRAAAPGLRLACGGAPLGVHLPRAPWLAILVTSSSSSNGPTTTTLTTRGLCPGGSVVWVGPKFVRPHGWRSWVIVRFLEIQGPNCDETLKCPQSNTCLF